MDFPKPITLLFLLFTLLYSASAQSPYSFSGGTDGPILGAGGLMIGAGLLIGRKVPAPTVEEIAALDAAGIWGPDRWSTRQNSLAAKKLSDKFLRGSFLLPLTLLAAENSRQDFGSASLLTLEAILLNSGITGLTKVIARRKRPFLYGENFRQYKWEEPSARMSFFSGHTSSTACMSFLTAQLYQDYYPASKGKGWIWGAAVAIPAITGYNRMRAGKHFLTDVLVGYAVGAAVGMLVPALHRIE